MDPLLKRFARLPGQLKRLFPSLHQHNQFLAFSFVISAPFRNIHVFELFQVFGDYGEPQTKA